MRSPILFVIILMINKSDSRFAVLLIISVIRENCLLEKEVGINCKIEQITPFGQICTHVQLIHNCFRKKRSISFLILMLFVKFLASDNAFQAF